MEFFLLVEEAHEGLMLYLCNSIIAGFFDIPCSYHKYYLFFPNGNNVAVTKQFTITCSFRKQTLHLICTVMLL